MYKALYCFVLQMFCLQVATAADFVEKAFELDNKYYWKISFVYREENTSKDLPSCFYAKSVDLGKLKGQELTFLSRVFTKGNMSNINLSDDDCLSYISSFKVVLSPCTPIENIKKIQSNEKNVAKWKTLKLQSESDRNHVISCWKQQGLWGPIIDEETKHQSKEIISRIISQNVNNFLIRHTISISEYGLSGLVVIYPGHNTKILEDGCCDEQKSPVWAVGDLKYTITFFTGKLKIDLVTVNAEWQKKGHGYAMVQYITDFAKEHFACVSMLTTSCRHEVSTKLFEKAGFVKTQSSSDDTTHFRANDSNCDGWRAQYIMRKWHESDERYRPWFNENYAKIMSNEYHKVGFNYF